MNNNQLKQKVLNQIKQIKTQNELKTNSNLSLAQSNQDFKTLYAHNKQLQIEKVKLEIENKDFSKIEAELTKTNAQMQKILKSFGLTLNDLVPKYNCPKCGDTGIVNGVYCSCFYKLFNEECIKSIGAFIDRTHTFENANFDLFENKEKQKQVFNTMNLWCEKANKSAIKNILISGNTGVGKTYLLECICNNLVNKNLVVNYYTAFALNNLFLKYQNSFQENKMAILEGVLNCDVLIIDDFGSEPISKNGEQYFYSLINERTIKNLSTIISTNLLPMQVLDKYGERTFSRLSNKANSLMIKIENSDIRLKKQKKD